VTWVTVEDIVLVGSVGMVVWAIAGVAIVFSCVKIGEGVGEVWFGFEILRVVDPGEGRVRRGLAQGRST